MSVATPLETWISTIQSLTGLAASTFVTATIQLTAGWEIRLPFQGVQASNVSAGPYLQVFEAIGLGTGTPPFATIPMTQIAITNKASGNDVMYIRLDTGIYCLALGSGGPNTATVGILTAIVVTAVQNA